MSASEHLGPQFVYHGTTREISGGRVLPAKVHGGPSFWGSTGSTRGEPSEDHAWAHPDEHTVWEAAMDRVQAHYLGGYETGEDPGPAPRARVYALHPNEHQTPGNDKSMAGELKAPHFDIAHVIDTQPGHQGTFPEVNWNHHVTHPDGSPRWLPGDDDANHPTDLAIQYGHAHGLYGEEGASNRLHDAAFKEHVERGVERANEVLGKPSYGQFQKDEMLPGMSSDGRRYQRNKYQTG